MATLPLEVDEVLADEYCALYNDEPKDVAYDDFEILDGQEEWACALLHDCDATADAKQPATIVAALQAFVHGDAAKAAKLGQSRAITEIGRRILDDYDDYAENEKKEKLNRRIVDAAMRGAIKPLRDMRLEKVYSALHARRDDDARAALCISGGGIRTATFAFGVIQGLASAGILKRFDYLSTVSGGGYIGSWLSSWIRRHPKGVAGVEDDLVRADTSTTQKPKRPQSKLDPEPAPIRHLRDYSNYLSPKLGVTSLDSWTMASLYIRNLMLNLLVLVPILAGILAAPRYASAVLRWSETHPSFFFPHALLVASVVFFTWGFGYLGAKRPVTQGTKGKRSNPNAAFIINCIVPLTLAATALCLFWANAHVQTLADLKPYLWWLVATFLATAIWPALIYYARYWTTPAAELHTGLSRDGRGFRLKKMGNEFIAAIVAFGTALLLLVLVAFEIFPDPTRLVVDNVGTLPFLRSFVDTMPEAQLFVCFGVPLLLVIFFVQASIFVGLSGKLNEDSDREWWGRAGAYLLFFAVVLGVGSLIAVLGPVYLYRAPIILGSIGGFSGVAAALFGFSAQTPANDKQKGESSKGSAAMGIVSKFAVPLFVVIALAGISLGTTWLIQQVTGTGVHAPSAEFTSQFESQATSTEKIEFQGRVYEVKIESPKAATALVPMMEGVAHLRTVERTNWWQAAAIIGVAVFGFVLSLFIGVNRFSMHALYRNRLVRGYLAASRYNRDPDPFTGFDDHDNLSMADLRPELVWASRFVDPAGFVKALVAARAGSGDEKALADAIWGNLGRAQNRLASGKDISGALLVQLTMAINEVLLGQDLATMAPTAAAAFAATKDRVKRNRQILDNRFPSIGAYTAEREPLHVINTALNLTSAEKLGWQQRQAESFTVSPLHSGSLYVGYRRSDEYGGPEGISVGTAVAISGAAASPNMGYNSSPPLAFLLTLLNVRLGWWLGNPGIAGTGVYTDANPSSNVNLLFKELTGQSNDAYAWVYLSDGGHFENLGVYEMVLRRCRYIVVSDGGCDPKFTFEDLGNAIRKIRTDLGVPIEIEHMYMLPRTPETANFPDGRYVATANIRYSAIDKDGVDGKLIYIKPGLYSEDYFPKDVYNYALSSSAFPHEPTSDQFFSESQFESYRALGRHAIDEICGNYSPRQTNQYKSVAEFASKIVPQPTKEEQPALVAAADALSHAATSFTAMLDVRKKGEEPRA